MSKRFMYEIEVSPDEYAVPVKTFHVAHTSAANARSLASMMFIDLFPEAANWGPIGAYLISATPIGERSANPVGAA